jgi:hypothetical protein
MTDITENQHPEDLHVDDASSTAAEPAAQSDDTRDLVEAAIAKIDEKPEPSRQEPEPEPDAKPAHNPFNSWKKEAQAELAKLPAHVQEMIKDREAQFHKGAEQYRSESQFARRMDKAFAPHAGYMKELGITPEAAVANLLHTESTLRQGTPQAKTAMLQQLAHAYGIDLNQAAGQPFDPRVNQLEQQNHWLNSQHEDHKAAQQHAETQHKQAAIQTFKQTHEHYEAVKPTMALLITKGLAKTVDEAYDKATRMDDEVYGKVQARQLESAKRAQNLQANQAAKAAKAANVSVRGAPTGVTHARPADTTEQAVRNAMAQHGLLT